MFPIPNPLHPALVHFPIVFLLLGTLAVCASVFFNHRQLCWSAAALLACGAAGCILAVQTGESAKETAGQPAGEVESMLEAHEEWAERTEFASAAAATLAIVAAMLGTVSKRRESRLATTALRPPTDHGVVGLSALALSSRVSASIIALIGCYFIFQTGRIGGDLVYSHGLGIRAGAGGQAQPHVEGVHHDDD